MKVVDASVVLGWWLLDAPPDDHRDSLEAQFRSYVALALTLDVRMVTPIAVWESASALTSWAASTSSRHIAPLEECRRTHLLHSPSAPRPARHVNTLYCPARVL